MSTVNLNLARKWRSRNFDQVIGQELTVRILKNSLYRNHFFPLYLFSGQHGCGKTTTARIFAAALNCEKIDLFQKEPKEHSIPCLQCISCKAMASGNHPDFIEIDGASYTGVDNVRHIIDVASFLPLMGRKKIYLIDEAHMLSKAAFNAFLKILEEPPASVVFMLATTEHYKIIETVRSRSFQLFFTAINHTTLSDYLQYVCVQETIACEYDALEIIAQQSKGSVRDALNLLEQVRFEGNQITKDIVQKVLGHIDESAMLSLFECVVQGDAARLLSCIQENSCHLYRVEILWKSLIELLNTCVWMKYGLPLKKYGNYEEHLRAIVAGTSLEYLNACLKLLFEHELLCSKTGFAWYLFEMILLRMCHERLPSDPNGQSNGLSQPFVKKNEKGPSAQLTAHTDSSLQAMSQGADVAHDDYYKMWHMFVSKIDQEDPLVGSIFKQARYEAFNADTTTLIIYFGNEFTFFNDIIEKSQPQWQPILNATMNKAITLHVVFKEVHKAVVAKAPVAAPVQKKLPTPSSNTEKSKPFVKNNYYTKKNVEKAEALKTIDISNAEEWKKATMLKKVFDGTVQELPEGHNE